MIEKSANLTKGFILFNPVTNRYFFRIYHDQTFTDYDIRCEELEVQIIGDWYSFYESEQDKYLDWNSKTLGKKL